MPLVDQEAFENTIPGRLLSPKSHWLPADGRLAAPTSLYNRVRLFLAIVARGISDNLFYVLRSYAVGLSAIQMSLVMGINVRAL